jgi:hypothetical protein
MVKLNYHSIIRISWGICTLPSIINMIHFASDVANLKTRFLDLACEEYILWAIMAIRGFSSL